MAFKVNPKTMQNETQKNQSFKLIKDQGLDTELQTAKARWERVLVRYRLLKATLDEFNSQ